MDRQNRSMIVRNIAKLTSLKTVRRTALASYAMVARSLQQVSALVITLLAARFLMPAEYGIYSLGIVFMVLIQTMTYTGYFHWIVVAREDDEEVLSTSFWMITALSTIASLLFALAAYPLEYLFDAPQLGLVIILLVAGQPFAAYTAWSSAVLLRRKKIKVNLHMQFIQNIVALVGGVILLSVWQSLFALVAFRWLRVITGLIIFQWIGIRPPLTGFSRQLARVSTSFASGLYGSRALVFASKYSSDLLLGLFFGPAQVGLYRFGNRVATGATDSIVQPMGNFAITQFGAQARGDRKIAMVLRRFAGSMGLLTGMIGAGVIVFAEEAIELFFQDAYLAALVVTYALALRGAAGTGRWLLEPTFASLGRTGVVAAWNLGSTITSIATVFLVTPFGMEALAWTQAGLTLGNTVAAFLLIRYKGKVKVAGAVLRYAGGLLLAAAYGLIIWAMNVYLVPQLGLQPLWSLIAGLALAMAMGPVILFIASRLRIFTLDVFSG